MRLEEECKLSYYQQIAALNEEHGVYLVQHVESKGIFVKKILKLYNADIFRYLMARPIVNTPRIYEVIEDADRLIVIEEYMSGTTLQQVLEEKRALDELEVINIVGQLCSVLEAFHQSQPPIVHRDIKPSNIIISPDGIVKLIDMNAAKWLHCGVGQDTMLMGTVGYAAPEQYGFAASNTKTDIYSVGVLMNVMLTGVLLQERVALGPLGDIIGCCTRMNPHERYQSIGEVIQAIERYQNKTSGVMQGTKYPYAPPGFRSFRPLKMIFASLGYYVIVALGLSLHVETASSLVMWLNRIIFILICISIIFFLGDYRGVQKKLGVPYIKNKLLRVLLGALAAVAILFIGVFVLVIAEQFMG